MIRQGVRICRYTVRIIPKCCPEVTGNSVRILPKYAFAPIENKYDKQKERMGLVINRIRDEINQNNNFELFYLFAISIRNFTSWYIRGDERKKYLDEVIFYLEKSIGLNDKFVEAKAELGLLLIEQKVVRNLEKGYSILNGLKNINQLPLYLD